MKQHNINSEKKQGNEQTPLKFGLKNLCLSMGGHDIYLLNIGGKPFASLEPVANLLQVEIWELIELAGQRYVLLASLEKGRGEGFPFVALESLDEVIPTSLKGATLARLISQLWAFWCNNQAQNQGVAA